jgi:hypothetical protein
MIFLGRFSRLSNNKLLIKIRLVDHELTFRPYFYKIGHNYRENPVGLIFADLIFVT